MGFRAHSERRHHASCAEQNPAEEYRLRRHARQGGSLNVLELFAGAGGGIYGCLLLGHTPVCAVEIVYKNRELLLQRQRDGIMPRFPIWDDVRTFDGKPWRGIVDIVSGGFPCTDISLAGKGAGIDGKHSGLWREMARIVREVRPRYVFVENSSALITRGLGRVLSDLAACGYDCRWTCLSAADCGAQPKRDRVWILGANSESVGCRQIRPRGASALCQDWIAEKNSYATSERRGEEREHRRDEPKERAAWICKDVSYSDRLRIGESTGNTEEIQEPLRQTKREKGTAWAGPVCAVGEFLSWPTEPGVCRVADGVADWKYRIFALGNGQVPRVHAAAWRILTS